jgi:hypothetical protein
MWNALSRPHHITEGGGGRLQGRIQDFKLGAAHLKKLRRAEEGAKIFGVFRKKKPTTDTTQSEQFQNPIEKWYKDAKSIPLTHKYMPA